MKPTTTLTVTWPPPGRYVLAVSGGADSMVLLHLMAGAASSRGYQLVVAHLDHGVRPDSAQDRRLVQAAATAAGLAFEYHEARLGRGVSEAAARAVRHDWLGQVRRQHQAAAVITAHHSDDLLETSLLNLVRGTGRRGLAPMQPAAAPQIAAPILRPLLAATRTDLRTYASTHHLTWHEDSTNLDLTNPRNYLRRHLLSAAPTSWRTGYATLIKKMAQLNKKIDQTLEELLSAYRVVSSIETEPENTLAEYGDEVFSGYSFPRRIIQNLSLSELEELILAAARHLHPGFEPNLRLIQEIALFAKTAPPHRYRPLSDSLQVAVQPGSIHVYYIGISDSKVVTKVGKNK